jgi:neutral ceramidase
MQPIPLHSSHQARLSPACQSHADLCSSRPRPWRFQQVVLPAIRLACLLGMALVTFSHFSHVASAEELPWKAGLAKAIITPETPVWLAGYGSKRAPEGKLHDLWMKALALEDQQGRRAVLITSDFQGVPKSMSDQVFQQLQQQHGLDRRQVMFTFSHNHCGPRLGDDLVDYYPVEEEQVELVAEYTKKMVTRTVELVGEALENLAPARLAMGEGKTTFAVNRRNNPEAEVPRMLAEGIPLEGPVDHAVPVLTVTRTDGELAAILFGYACHPTTLSFMQWCGDYPGFAQLALEQNHPTAMAMFVNTCGGDQNPIPRRTVELCARYGRMLADAVEQVLEQPLQPISGELKTEFKLIDLAYQEVVSHETLHELLQDGNAIRARWAARMLQKLDEGEVFPPTYPYPLHAWSLGKELLIIGMGAETVVDFSLRFKEEFGPGTWVFGYADDMIAYIPSRRVWEEGGYEGGSSLYEYGRPAFRWAGDVEQRIATAVHRLVEMVRPGALRQIGSAPREQSVAARAGTLRVAHFQADATPPIGSPVAYAPARKIEDPLSARGIVLLGAGDPIVLCAVDWIGIGNQGHDAWKTGLARAAGTTPDRVTVHTLHQHDGPRCDFASEALLEKHGLGGTRFDNAFARKTIEKTAQALRESLEKSQPVTHLGIGQAEVEKVASNRRILGDDGRVRLGRMSSTRNPEAIAAPEGVIDPLLRMVSLWNEDDPLVCLTYYATHPQSYYGQGDVTAEFIGLARAERERALDGLPHVHFNGAGGNVAAGKYNDGSPENRPVLMQRMVDAKRRAWEATEKQPISAEDVQWRVEPVSLPLAEHLDEETLQQTLADADANERARLSAATKLAYLGRANAGHPIELSRLRLGSASILHMPGELFVEYQLEAQKMRPEETVCMAAYGDYGPGYIGTEVAYFQGGYETQPSSSNVSPQVERVLMAALRRLLD